ncbi:hypothetical protein H9I32_08430 [Bacillus sp. Xin]|uniref:hypothetical protein n=1 Tax=unclassified Bacillus (in: firmicutes) TaxID=185979 RepID=UPI0015729DFA|nr:MULTISPECIES: hypothetical protein [unclassified Bacillus (in: firmicutes)]MBC6972435.1 hypothetical protein [Bacillus sp. Xin]NSW39456.1 hypothetical protein [Bacillus sp. Xin1]
MDIIEEKVKKYNQVKADLMKIAQCIDYCSEDERELYQDIALNYSKQLKHIKESIEKIYGVELCNCCPFSDK